MRLGAGDATDGPPPVEWVMSPVDCVWPPGAERDERRVLEAASDQAFVEVWMAHPVKDIDCGA